MSLREWNFLDWNFQEFTMLGNTVQRWIAAVVVALLLVLVLRFLRGRLTRTLRALSDKTKTGVDDMIADMFARTKLFVLIVVSLWAGAQLLSLPDNVETFLCLASDLLVPTLERVSRAATHAG